MSSRLVLAVALAAVGAVAYLFLAQERTGPEPDLGDAQDASAGRRTEVASDAPRSVDPSSADAGPVAQMPGEGPAQAGEKLAPYKFQVGAFPATLIERGLVKGADLVAYMKRFGELEYLGADSKDGFHQTAFDVSKIPHLAKGLIGEDLLIVMREQGFDVDPTDNGFAIHKRVVPEELPEVIPEPLEDDPNR